MCYQTEKDKASVELAEMKDTTQNDITSLCFHSECNVSPLRSVGEVHDPRFRPNRVISEIRIIAQYQHIEQRTLFLCSPGGIMVVVLS